MDRQDQRKRAFSQAFQRMNQPRLSDNDSQAAKRIFSPPFVATALYRHDYNQENETPLDLDYNVAFEQIPGTQVRHPLPIDLQYAKPALYNYASLQYELYGNGPGLELKSDVEAMPLPVAPKRQFDGPVLREAALPTPQIVRGHSMLGPSPYIRPDYESPLGDVLDSYGPSGGSPISDTTTAVGPLTPSALNFGDLSLNSQGYSLALSPLQDGGRSNRSTVRIVPIASFARLFPAINPNEVIVLFNKGKEARKVDKYPLCTASRFFAESLDGPFLDHDLTRCIRLRGDFSYAITSMLLFIETGNYLCDPQAFVEYPLLTILDFHVHAYLVGSKYGITALRDRAMDAYLSVAEHEVKLGFAALSSGCLYNVQIPLPGIPIISPADGSADGEPMMMPIDRFLNSLVLLYKNTPSSYDGLRAAVLELIKRDLSKLLQMPFFVTLTMELVGFGDDVVASLSDDGFEVKAFQVLEGGRRAHTMRFGV